MAAVCAKLRLERMELCQAMGKQLCWELVGGDQREGKGRGCDGAILHVANVLWSLWNNLQPSKTSNTLPALECPATMQLNICSLKMKVQMWTGHWANHEVFQKHNKDFSSLESKILIQNIRYSHLLDNKQTKNQPKNPTLNITKLKLLALLLLVFRTRIYIKPYQIKSQRKDSFTNLWKTMMQSASPPFSTSKEAELHSRNVQ